MPYRTRAFTEMKHFAMWNIQPLSGLWRKLVCFARAHCAATSGTLTSQTYRAIASSTPRSTKDCFRHYTSLGSQSYELAIPFVVPAYGQRIAIMSPTAMLCHKDATAFMNRKQTKQDKVRIAAATKVCRRHGCLWQASQIAAQSVNT